jgi:ribosome hibernation promoting factor
MRLELTGRHVEITPALRRLVTGKLGRLERLLNDRAVSAQVVLVNDKYRRLAEVTLHARGEKFLHGVAAADTFRESIGTAVDKITRQARTMKGKLQDRKRTAKAPVRKKAVRRRP